MKLIERPDLLKKIVSHKDHTGIIKVITGIRRCGKSTLFELYKDYLLNNGIKQEQIIHIDLDNLDNKHLTGDKVLYEYIKSKILSEEMHYIFLDEIQNVNNFQLLLNSLNKKNNVDLYITGSNAHLLSGELATLLSGRYIQIKVYPLSFKEYLNFLDYNNQIDITKKNILFEEYKTYGGFPFITNYRNDKDNMINYLEGIYNTVVVKDVLQRNKIDDNIRLEKIMLFLADNIGSLTSINNIKNQMVNDNFRINVATIENYISSLLNSFLIYKVPRYNIKGKELLKTNDKYYIADMGLRYYLLRKNDKDLGHMLENIVYLELLRRDYKVYVGKYNSLEVDFVAIKEDNKLYIQVCETLLGEQTREREFKPLKMIDDNYRKIIITKDIILSGNSDGIEYKNIIDWLLE